MTLAPYPGLGCVPIAAEAGTNASIDTRRLAWNCLFKTSDANTATRAFAAPYASPRRRQATRIAVRINNITQRPPRKSALREMARWRPESLISLAQCPRAREAMTPAARARAGRDRAAARAAARRRRAEADPSVPRAAPTAARRPP